MAKKRADLYLVESGVVESRERAKQLIEEGRVVVGGKLVSKPSTLLEPGLHIEIESTPEYVSRGGFKLEKALEHFSVQVSGKSALDAGVGTGGFTDCLLKHGVKSVVSVDVGYGQVAWSIRNDPRVILLERTNIRELKPSDIADATPSGLYEPVDIVTVDLSFISILKVIDVLLSLAKPGADFIILVKPQFEAGRELVGKKGIVRDPGVHRGVLADTVKGLRDKGVATKGITFSPIKGREGNIEFLLYAVAAGAETEGDWSATIGNVVEGAHKEL